MTADEFDAWMKARQVRVATGKPGDARQAAPSHRVRRAASAVVTAACNASAAAPRRRLRRAAKRRRRVVLQVASFAARDNAERALAMLQGAGIGDARLLDADADGPEGLAPARRPGRPARAVAELSAPHRGSGLRPAATRARVDFAHSIPRSAR